MSQIRSRLTPVRIQLLFGLSLAAILFIEFQTSSTSTPVVLAPPVVIASESKLAASPNDRSFESLLRRDPLAALEQAREDHLRAVRDYTCTFVKQEQLDSGMSQEQTIAVKFRQEPYSVVMHWLKNAGKAERVIYVKDRWVDHEESDPALRDEAVCQPGAIARLLVKSLRQPIRGSMARQSSRRNIDEFGFARSLDLLIKYSRIASGRGELSLKFLGQSEFNGRPTWVIERQLPYSGPDGEYPDRVALIHLDQEWRVPVSVHCFADDARKQLLGRYEYGDVVIGPGLSETDFEPKTYGM